MKKARNIPGIFHGNYMALSRAEEEEGVGAEVHLRRVRVERVRSTTVMGERKIRRGGR
jgi:hypothetical protein